jgi:hypothetical protein
VPGHLLCTTPWVREPRSNMNSTELMRLMDGIASCDADVRSESIAILDGAGRKDLPSLQPLISGLASSHSSVAFWCLTKLKRLGASEAAGKIKSACLHHSSVAIRQASLDALSEWLPDDTEVREAVMRCIHEEELPLRWSAMRAVLTIGRWTNSDLDRVKACLIDDKSWMSKMIHELDPA